MLGPQLFDTHQSFIEQLTIQFNIYEWNPYINVTKLIFFNEMVQTFISAKYYVIRYVYDDG